MSEFLQSSKHLALIEVCRLEPEVESLEAPEGNGLREYTAIWSVNIPDGPKAADEIAKKHGFINTGPVIFSYVIYRSSAMHI